MKDRSDVLPHSKCIILSGQCKSVRWRALLWLGRRPLEAGRFSLRTRSRPDTRDLIFCPHHFVRATFWVAALAYWGEPDGFYALENQGAS